MEKIQRNIGIFGQPDSGKSTLIKALSTKSVETSQSDYNFFEINKTKLGKQLADNHIHAAVIIVSATIGPMSYDSEYLKTLESKNIPVISVFLNRCDEVDDIEMIETVEEAIYKELANYEFTNIPIVRGSAKIATLTHQNYTQAIDELISNMMLFFNE